MFAMVLMVFVMPVQGQEKGVGAIDPGVPTYVCKRATGPITIDGKLDEPSWQKAETTRAFVFPWPDQKGAKQQTTAKLLWDDDALYVAFDCWDNDITATYENRDDTTYKDDCVEIFLAPAPGRTVFYYGNEMNARGVMFDYFFAWPSFLLKQFDLKGFELATQLHGTLNDSSDKDSRWFLELKIPFDNFEGLAAGPKPEDGERWRMQMNRWDGTDEERALSEWTPSGKKEPDPHRPKGFGILEFSAKEVGG
jgi:hypothetical protein